MFQKYSPMGNDADYYRAAHKALVHESVECAFYDRDDCLCSSKGLNNIPIGEMESFRSGTVDNYHYNSILRNGECIGFVVYKDIKHTNKIKLACQMVANLLE